MFHLALLLVYTLIVIYSQIYSNSVQSKLPNKIIVLSVLRVFTFKEPFILQNMVYFVGVDVGTGSVRAGLFDEKGQMINICTQSIKMWNPSPNFFEQSSTDIWNSCCYVVKVCTSLLQLNPSK